MDQCFNIKEKRLLEHFFNISKINLYKHIKKPLDIETIEKTKTNAVRH